MMKTGITTIIISMIAAMMTNRSASPIGPLGSNKSIVLQPPRRVVAHRDDKPTKKKYFRLFIYPPMSQGFYLGIKRQYSGSLASVPVSRLRECPPHTEKEPGQSL